MSCWLDKYCEGSRKYECTSEACPREHPQVAQEYIIDIIVHEFVSHDRSLDPGLLHHRIGSHYHHDIAYIAAHNGHQRKPPKNKAGSHLSKLILTIQLNDNLYLSPRTMAKHEGRAIYDPQCHSRRPLGDVSPAGVGFFDDSKKNNL
jgi:hypothetical protein